MEDLVIRRRAPSGDYSPILLRELLGVVHRDPNLAIWSAYVMVRDPEVLLKPGHEIVTIGLGDYEILGRLAANRHRAVVRSMIEKVERAELRPMVELAYEHYSQCIDLSGLAGVFPTGGVKVREGCAHREFVALLRNLARSVIDETAAAGWKLTRSSRFVDLALDTCALLALNAEASSEERRELFAAADAIDPEAAAEVQPTLKGSKSALQERGLWPYCELLVDELGAVIEPASS